LVPALRGKLDFGFFCFLPIFAMDSEQEPRENRLIPDGLYPEMLEKKSTKRL